MSGRPDFIRHWRELETPDDSHYPGDEELMSIGAPLAAKLGLTRLGIHHERLPPGRRTSYPHAESAEEEFVYVLEGTPDVWIDGTLHRLAPGDSVAFRAGTGIAHSFLNNTAADIRILVIGERPKPENRIHYPLHRAYEQSIPEAWSDAPTRPLGPHDGRPEASRPSSSAKAPSASPSSATRSSTSLTFPAGGEPDQTAANS